PFRVAVLKNLDRFVIGDAREWSFDVFQLGYITANRLQVVRASRQNTLHNVADEVLRQLHDVIELGVGDFRLHHPELSQVAARFRFFCTERWTKRVDLAQRHGRGFNVKLAGLREVRLLIKVIDRKQRGGSLARRRRKDGRISKGKAAIIKEIS